MSDAAAREWRFYVDDMITFAEKVLGIVVTDVPALLPALRALRQSSS